MRLSSEGDASQSTPTGECDSAGSARIWSWACVFIALLSAGLLIRQGPLPCDDAYITFRHARNLIEHGRPAWNLLGQPVMGSTAPAYLLTLSVAASPFDAERIPTVALWLNAGFHFLSVLLACGVMRILLRQRLAAFLAGALVGLASVNVFVAAQGFENAMLIAVLLASIYAALRRRDTWAALFASVAPLVRPEGVVVAPLLLAYLLLRGRFRFKLLATYALLPLLWAVFAFAWYGSPIPQPIRTKMKFPAIYQPYHQQQVDLVTRLEGLPSHVASFWNDMAGPVLLTGQLEAEPSLPAGVRLGILMVGLAALAFRVWRERDGRYVLLLYAPLFLVLYAWIGSSQSWYFPSFVTFGRLLAFAGVTAAADLAARYGSLGSLKAHARWLERAVLVVAFLLLSFSSHYAWTTAAEPDGPGGFLSARDPRGPRWEHWERERLHGYTRAARYLNELTIQRGPVLISEVGVFGFHYDGDVIDAVGICSPEVLPFYPPPQSDIYDSRGRYRTPSNNFVPTAMLESLDPGFVVNARLYLLPLLRSGSPLLRDYRLVGSEGTAWSSPILIYQRRSQSSEF